MINLQIYILSILVDLGYFIKYKLDYKKYTPSGIFSYTLLDLIIDLGLMLIIFTPIVNTIVAAALTVITIGWSCEWFLAWASNITIWGKK